MPDTTKEEIRLFLEHVKHKKTEGELFLMKERIAWMPKNQGTFTLSHRYEEIKTYKISTEGKSKIQLQIIMNDNSSAAFHFVNPEGQKQQLKERDQVKDLLADLLPKFRQKISNDLEDKKRILLENPNLYQLYNDLVVSSIISAEDFWNNYAEISKLKADTAKNQIIGVSQRFLSNLKPKTDGSTGMTFNLTFDDKQSIFKTYPSVSQKYQQYVPHRMSEVDFWTKFIQSHFFHANKAIRPDDLFADCKGKDSVNIKLDQQTETININNQKDGIGYDGFDLTDFSTTSTFHNPNEDLVKHFNYYSMRILNSMDENNLTNQPTEHPINKIVAETIKNDEEEIQDLCVEDDRSSKKLKGSPLYLTDIDRYIYGSMKSNDDNLYLTNNLDLQNYKYQLNQLKTWNLNLSNVSNPMSALGILKELTPGGTLMNGSTMQNFQDEIPEARKEELKMLYTSLCELLRHFWACFPPTSAKLEAKFELMKNSLEGFQRTKIDPFREKLSKDNLSCDLTAHLDSLVNTALQRYKKRRFKQINS